MPTPQEQLIAELEEENAWVLMYELNASHVTQLAFCRQIPLMAPKEATTWTLSQIEAFFDDGTIPGEQKAKVRSLRYSR